MNAGGTGGNPLLSPGRALRRLFVDGVSGEMSTTKYILTGDGQTRTHIHLGLEAGALSIAGQTFVARGSAGANSFFLHPAGYSFDFTDNGLGDDTIYLTGARAHYDVDEVDGVKILTGGTGANAETVRVSAVADNLTLVFADGALTAAQLQTAPGEPSFDTDNMSVDFDGAPPSTGGVRIGAVGANGQTNVVGLDGLTFTAIGNSGVDEVFVAAGGRVDATELGVGKDHIYLEGTWSNYTKTLTGSQITLTRRVTNALTGAFHDEEVKVAAGFGASNDRLIFSDGAVDTRAALLAMRNHDDGVNVDITGDATIWDSSQTSFSSAAPLDGLDDLTVAFDTGALADDGVTSNGFIAVSGVADGYAWQYRTSDTGAWVRGEGDGFTLAGQDAGDEGRLYAAGQVQVRQVNPFGVASEAVVNARDIIVDVIAADPSVTVGEGAPPIVEAAGFNGGVFTLRGTIGAGFVGLRLSLSDGGAGTDDTSVVEAEVNAETGAWTAVFDEAELAAMTDGALAVSFTATDGAGNEVPGSIADAAVLELVNQAPQIREGVELPTVTLIPGTFAGGGGGLLVDFKDIGGESVFFDEDAPGSVNGTLEYRGALSNGGALPSWLNVTEDGELQIAPGQSVPEFGGALTVRVTARNPSGGEEVFRDVTLATPLRLTSAMHRESRIDVRSGVSIESEQSGEDIVLTNTDGIYHIRLNNLPDSATKSGFDGEDSISSQTITVTVAGGRVTEIVGGAIRFVGGKAVLDFDHDLDLSNNYGVEVDAGLFRSSASGSVNEEVVAGEVEFATITPLTGGSGARTLNNDAEIVAGARWYDGTGGDYGDNIFGLTDVDLSGHAGVVVIGRDTDPTSGVNLRLPARARILGFGADDLIYIDRDMSDAANEFNGGAVIRNSGEVPTELQFSGDSTIAGVFIDFADDPDTVLVESDEVASVFYIADADPGPGPGREYSFEELTGNPEPVISG